MKLPTSVKMVATAALLGLAVQLGTSQHFYMSALLCGHGSGPREPFFISRCQWSSGWFMRGNFCATAPEPCPQ
jgi:hypothetical protein